MTYPTDITAWDDDYWVEWCQARGLDVSDPDVRVEAMDLHSLYIVQTRSMCWQWARLALRTMKYKPELMTDDEWEQQIWQ